MTISRGAARVLWYIRATRAHLCQHGILLPSALPRAHPRAALTDGGLSTLPFSAGTTWTARQTFSGIFFVPHQAYVTSPGTLPRSRANGAALRICGAATGEQPASATSLPPRACNRTLPSYADHRALAVTIRYWRWRGLGASGAICERQPRLYAFSVTGGGSFSRRRCRKYNARIDAVGGLWREAARKLRA